MSGHPPVIDNYKFTLIVFGALQPHVHGIASFHRVPATERPLRSR